MLTRATGSQWVLFVFTATRPSGPADGVATDEGELRWVPFDEVGGLPVVSDIPIILPHLFGGREGVLMAKIRCDNDDADSMLDYSLRVAG